MSRGLYELTTKQVVDSLADDVIENFPEVKSKKYAKDLILNALVSNTVNEEIMGQVKFLIEEGGYFIESDEEEMMK